MEKGNEELPRRRLGRTDYEVTELSVGGWLGLLDDPQAPTVEKERAAIEAVRRVIVGLLPSVDLWVLAERIQSSDEVLARYAEMDTLLVELFRRGQRSGVFCVTQSATWMTDALYALLTRAVLAAHDGRLAR